MRPTKLTVRMVCERLCEGWRAFREARIFSLSGYTLRYCRRCSGWGAEPNGSACLLCGGQGWKSKKRANTVQNTR